MMRDDLSRLRAGWAKSSWKSKPWRGECAWCFLIPSIPEINWIPFSASRFRLSFTSRRGAFVTVFFFHIKQLAHSSTNGDQKTSFAAFFHKQSCEAANHSFEEWQWDELRSDKQSRGSVYLNFTESETTLLRFRHLTEWLGLVHVIIGLECLNKFPPPLLGSL